MRRYPGVTPMEPNLPTGAAGRTARGWTRGLRVTGVVLALLVVIAAALFAFIYFYDRDRMTTGELEGRKDRVFVEFRSEPLPKTNIGKILRRELRDGAAADPPATATASKP